MIEVGIVRITIKAPLGSPKNNNTINPVSIAPMIPSVIRLVTELIT